MPNGFFTLDYLGTFTGLVAAVYVVVRFTKGFFKDRWGDVLVRPFSAIVAFLLQLFVLGVQQRLGFESAVLAVLNAILVALSANGLHETINDPRATKQKPIP